MVSKAQRLEHQTQKLENYRLIIAHIGRSMVRVDGNLKVAVTLEYIKLCKSVFLQPQRSGMPDAQRSH